MQLSNIILTLLFLATSILGSPIATPTTILSQRAVKPNTAAEEGEAGAAGVAGSSGASGSGNNGGSGGGIGEGLNSLGDALQQVGDATSTSTSSSFINHPTQAFSSGISACMGQSNVQYGAYGSRQCCSGTIINGKCYDTTRFIKSDNNGASSNLLTSPLTLFSASILSGVFFWLL